MENKLTDYELNDYDLYLTSFLQLMSGVEMEAEDLEMAAGHNKNPGVGLAIVALAADDTKESRRLRTREEFKNALHEYFKVVPA